MIDTQGSEGAQAMPAEAVHLLKAYRHAVSNDEWSVPPVIAQWFKAVDELEDARSQ